jgi:hypothetical protein
MRHVRRDEMGDAPMLLELGFERFCEARGGVKPKITARQAQHGHPDGERQTEYLKRAAEAVLDMLDQSQAAPHANNVSAADDVIVALSRSLETSGLLKVTETAAPSAKDPLAEETHEPMKRSAQ